MALVAVAVLLSVSALSVLVLAILVSALTAVLVGIALLADAFPLVTTEPARTLRLALAPLSSGLPAAPLAALSVAAHAGCDVFDHLGEAALTASATLLTLSIPSLLAEVLPVALAELPRTARPALLFVLVLMTLVRALVTVLSVLVLLAPLRGLVALLSVLMLLALLLLPVLVLLSVLVLAALAMLTVLVLLSVLLPVLVLLPLVLLPLVLLSLLLPTALVSSLSLLVLMVLTALVAALLVLLSLLMLAALAVLSLLVPLLASLLLVAPHPRNDFSDGFGEAPLIVSTASLTMLSLSACLLGASPTSLASSLLGLLPLAVSLVLLAVLCFLSFVSVLTDVVREVSHRVFS